MHLDVQSGQYVQDVYTFVYSEVNVYFQKFILAVCLYLVSRDHCPFCHGSRLLSFHRRLMDPVKNSYECANSLFLLI